MELRQTIVVDADTGSAEAGLGRVAKAAQTAGSEVDTAGRKAASSASNFGQLERGLGSLERQIVRIAGAWLIYKGAFEGIKGADEIADLQKQVDNLTNSVGAGASAMQFFQSVQTRTRATTEELMKVYEALAASNLGPGGFNQEQLQKFTVELVNAGTAAGVTTPKMLAFWEAVKRGEGARFDKDTMSKLGINNATAKNLDDVVKRIEDLNVQGEKMGLTFETALKKIASAWTIAFAGGMGDGQNAYATMLDKLTSPKILQAISQIGTAVMLVLGGIGGFVQALSGVIQSAFGLVVGVVSTITKFISDKIAWIFDKIASVASLGAVPGVDGGILSKLGDWAKGKANDFKADSSIQDNMKQYGFDTMLSGLKDIKTAFDGSSDAADKFSASLKTNAGHLDTNADKTKQAAQAAAKLKAQMDLFTRQDSAFDSFATKVNAAFDIGDENETPFERKIKSMQKQADLFATDAQKQISLAMDMVNHGLAVGDNREIEQGLKLWSEYELVLQGIPDKLEKATDAERIKQAAEETRKLAEVWHQVDQAMLTLADSERNALAGFANPNINPFGVNMQAGVTSILDTMNALKDVQGPFANEDQRRQYIEEMTQTYLKIGQQFIRDNVEASKKWSEGFTAPLTGILSDLALTGGKNFGQMAGQMFNKSVSDGMGMLSDVLGKMVIDAFGGGATVSQADYNPSQHENKTYDQYIQDQNQKQQALVGVFQGVVGALGQTIQMFQNAAKGQQTSVAGSTISFAAMGAAIGTEIAPGLGTVIGALVGALVGGIMASIANAEAKKKLPYAEFGVDANGNPYVRPQSTDREGNNALAANFQNLSQKDVTDYLNRMKSAVDDTITGFIKLFLKFPSDVLNGVTLGMAGGGIDGQIDMSNSHFLEQFSADINDFIDNVLPHEVMSRFHDETATVFERMGMTSDAFDKIWTQLDGMDPKDAMAVLNNIADALVAYSKVENYARNIGTNFANALFGGGSLGSQGQLIGPGVTPFDATVADTSANLDTLAEEVKTLPFADAAQAAADLGKGMEDLQKSLTDYLNHILDLSKQFSQSIEDDKFQAQMDATHGDKSQQSALLEAKYKHDLDMAQNWKAYGLSPDEASDYLNRARTDAKSLYDLDPDSRRAWYLSQLDQLNTFGTQIFQAIGNEAISATNAVLASVQPVMDWFRGLPGDASVGGAMNQLAAAATKAADALNTIGGGAASDASSKAAAAPQSANNTNLTITVDDPSGFVQDVRASRVAR